MKSTLSIVGLILLLTLTWALRVYHIGVIPKPEGVGNPGKKNTIWISKEEMGIHQVVLEGSAYERGVNFGRVTQELLRRQENILTEFLGKKVNGFLSKQLFLLGNIRWFWGIEKYLEDSMLQEMYGISLAASTEFNSWSDRFTRQVAYHGLHEVGQMMIDRGSQNRNWGCTVFAVPVQRTWMIGRNFDFEASRIFDEEKIMKWVFPDDGYPFVSVIWAGMVGVVTGVNAKGIYISINAAGSEDFRRHGTPSTLVLLKALQYAATAHEALEIIRNESMFITDIFVVVDSEKGLAYRVEKSPKKTVVLTVEGPEAITNHLVGKEWDKDQVNLSRMKRLTTIPRFERAMVLLSKLSTEDRADSSAMAGKMLGFLRDKSDAEGRSLHLGNRKAIDSLIATHAVIWDGASHILYVSQGPSLVGPFIGFDVRRSFEEKRPIRVGFLPQDPSVDRTQYNELKRNLKFIEMAESTLRRAQCEQGKKFLEAVAPKPFRHYRYFQVLGQYEACRGKREAAKEAWGKALSLEPAYAEEVNLLKVSISQ